MTLLSRSAQLQVDHAKDGIEDLQECISRLTIFMNGFELWFHHRDFDGRIAYMETAVAKVLIQHFGSESWEAHRLIERTRISSSPSRSKKDRRKRELEHTTAIAIEALDDAIRLLEERIENIKSGRVTSEPSTQRGHHPQPAPSKNPTVVRERTSRGNSNNPTAVRERTSRGNSNNPTAVRERTSRGNSNNPTAVRERTSRGNSNNPTAVRERASPGDSLRDILRRLRDS